MKRENPDGSERKHIIYKEEFRRQAMEMVIHSGKTQAQVERESGCSEYSLNWEKGALVTSPGQVVEKGQDLLQVFRDQSVRSTIL